MSWLSRVRSGIPFLPKRQSAENLWHKCGKCGTMVFTKEWEENNYVCPRCEYHGRIGTDVRLGQILDEGYELLPAPEVREDPLKFRDSKKYTDRLKAARANNAHNEILEIFSQTGLAGLGGACDPAQRSEHAFHDRTAAMAMQFDQILARRACRTVEPKHQGLVEKLAASGMPKRSNARRRSCRPTSWTVASSSRGAGRC